MKTAVIGAGTMGHSIAQTCGMVGYEVYIYDIKKEALNSAISKIKWSLDKFVEKKKTSEQQRDEILEKITIKTDFKEAVKEADFVFEAVFEDVELKRKIFKELDENTPKHAVLASTTSTIPITILGEATNRPDKVIGTHWFNPPVIQQLIEIIPGKETGKETVNATEELAKKLGKVPVTLKRDLFAFASSALYEHLLRESCWIVYNKEATPEEVDACARYKLGHPVGPLGAADYNGLDISYHIEFDVRKKIEAKWIEGPHPDICPLLVEYVKQGKLGVKTGEGFYKYPEKGAFKKVEISKEMAEKIDPVRLIASTISHAAYLLRTGVTTCDDLDKIVKLGLGYPKGVSEYANEYGIDNILKTLKLLKQKYRRFWYESDSLLIEIVKKAGTLKEV